MHMRMIFGSRLLVMHMRMVLSRMVLSKCGTQSEGRSQKRNARSQKRNARSKRGDARSEFDHHGSGLLVPRHRRQLGHVLQQDAAALQVQNAVLAPELQLAVDAFARGADEHA